MQHFERWNPIDKYSLTFKVFKSHHTELNDYLWSYIPIESFSKYLVRHDSKDLNIHKLFFISGSDSRRVPKEKTKWNNCINNFSNWTRINCLVTALSYLEIYMSRIVKTAVSSNLGTLIMTDQKIDGMRNIKYNLALPAVKIEEVVKGTWSQRIKGYKKLFGNVPDEINNNISDLEQMRLLRNRAAHAFSRKLKYQFRNDFNEQNMDRISLQRLLNYLSVIEEVALAVDKHLYNSHIGEYEILNIFHLRKNELPYCYPLTKEKKVSQIVNGNSTRFERTRIYCKEMLEYYNML